MNSGIVGTGRSLARLTSEPSACFRKIEGGRNCKWQSMTLETYIATHTTLDKEVLCTFLRNGISEKQRSIVWKVVAGYLPENVSLHNSQQNVKRKKYYDLVQYHFNVTRRKWPGAWKSVKEQINKDIPRTYMKPYAVFKCKEFQNVCNTTRQRSQCRCLSA